MAVIIAAEIHLIVNYVQKPVFFVETAQTHSQNTIFFAIAMLEAHQSFKSEWKGRYSDESDAAVRRSNNKNFFAGLA